jgi:GNAT superfamily N-acetyltransferase
MMIHIRIRPARSGDWSQFEPLVAGLCQFHGDQHGLTRAQFDDFTTRDDAPVTTLVAETESGILAGFAAGFATYDFHNGQTAFEIHDLFVAETFRRQRIGEILMTSIMQAARRKHGDVSFKLGAVNWNAPAIEFYKQLGFEQRAPTHDTIRLVRQLG